MPYVATVRGYHVPELKFHHYPPAVQAHLEAQFVYERRLRITQAREATWTNKAVQGDDEEDRDDDVKAFVKSDLEADSVPDPREPLQFTKASPWTDTGNGGHEADQKLGLSNPTEEWNVTGTTLEGEQCTATLYVWYAIVPT